MRSEEAEQELQQTIDRLQELHLQREEIQQEEQQVLEQLATLRGSQRTGPTPDGAISSGNVPAVQVQTPIVQATPESDSYGEEAGAAGPFLYEVGEHVYITNAISHVRLRRESPRDRAAVVYNVTRDKNGNGRVSVRTYNGQTVWRRPTNLRRLRDSERRRLGQPN